MKCNHQVPFSSVEIVELPRSQNEPLRAIWGKWVSGTGLGLACHACSWTQRQCFGRKGHICARESQQMGSLRGRNEVGGDLGEALRGGWGGVDWQKAVGRRP